MDVTDAITHAIDAVDDPTLTARQEKAIVALLAEPTIARAATAAGVGERTLHKWIRQPDFGAAYRRARREAFAQAIAGAHRLAAAAVQTLARIMLDTAAPYPSRVAAASALLRFSREAIELDDIAGRVEALEAGLEVAGSELATGREADTPCG